MYIFSHDRPGAAGEKIPILIGEIERKRCAITCIICVNKSFFPMKTGFDKIIPEGKHIDAMTSVLTFSEGNPGLARFCWRQMLGVTIRIF
jgi:hypothetical protein